MKRELAFFGLGLLPGLLGGILIHGVSYDPDNLCPGSVAHREDWPDSSSHEIGSWGWCQDAWDKAMQNTTANAAFDNGAQTDNGAIGEGKGYSHGRL